MYETSLEVHSGRKSCGEHRNENISTNYRSTNLVWCVADGETKKIAKVFSSLSESFIEWKVFKPTSPLLSLSLSQHLEETKKRNVIYANWWKFIYLHMKPSDVPCCEHSFGRGRESEIDKGTFLPKNSLKFCIFTSSTIFSAHTKGKSFEGEIFFNCFSNG